ncbi:MAG: AbrB/MazE/SpoVT family DNA-binding domain-containing protein [Promethearchaeota archaeon]|nr:MAG: AbrB/MazE/SpoVT family DNA-binding domain-containing protein [Candidatus Lokiarchaeota archaeon]
MEKQYILKIGSKGEIFPPKEVRDLLGFNKDQSIIMKVYSNRIIVQKIDSLEEILSKPTDVKISYHVLKNMESEFD